MIGKTNAISGVSAPVPIIKTVSGSVISISDALAMPAESLIADINAVQNLNGYDNPWPAGGGKNLLEWSNTSTTINGVTFTVNGDGSVLANGKASADASFYATVSGYTDLKAGTYIINGCPSGGSNTTYLINETVKSVSDTGSGVNLTLSEDTSIRVRILIRNGYTANNLLFKPMIRLASVTDATFAPYSNICPITGWTEAKVTRTGVNVWDEEWEVGALNINTGADITLNTTIRSKNYIPVKGGETYYRKSPSNILICQYRQDKSYIGYKGWGTGAVQLDADCGYIRFYVYTEYGTTYNNDISINYPSTATAYESYDGDTYTIDLDGTRYGGSLDVTTGVLTVDRAIVDLGTLSYGVTGSSRFYNVTRVSNFKFASSTAERASGLLCSSYPFSSSLSFNDNMDDNSMLRAQSTQGYDFVIRATAYGNDIYTFKTAMSGVQLVYELATPQTVQLSPTTVQMLLGNNTMWSDSGDSELQYWARR